VLNFIFIVLEKHPRIKIWEEAIQDEILKPKFMNLLEMINNNGTRLLMQSLIQVLEVTPSIHDRDFVKHVTNM